MNARLVLALAAMMAFSAAACDVRVGDKGGVFVDVDPRGRAEDQSTLTFPVAKGGQIELHTDDSNIEIVRAAGTSVEVQSRRVVRAGTDAEARKLLGQQPVTVEATPDRVIIHTVKADGPEARRRRGRVNYRLAVPVGSIVTARVAVPVSTCSRPTARSSLALEGRRADLNRRYNPARKEVPGWVVWRSQP
jgi:hypothetical protein